MIVLFFYFQSYILTPYYKVLSSNSTGTVYSKSTGLSDKTSKISLCLEDNCILSDKCPAEFTRVLC